jgi:glycosyltransferase involved in cell wall biosynthesis
MQNIWLRGDNDGIVNRERPDVLYEVYALFGYGGLALARRYGIPHILEVNAPLCIEQEGYKRFTLTETAQLMEDAIPAESDALVAVSDGLRDHFVSRGVDKSRAYVIPNGVADRLFSVVNSGEAVKSELGLAGKRVVGFVGTFHPWHDVDVLLDAFARLAGRDPDLALLLVGDGPGRQAAQTRAEALGVLDSVVFTGAIVHDRVPQLIAAMDVTAAPFKWSEDRFYFSPMKLFEYMAAGRPSVSTAIEQTTQIIDHGRTGWLCPPGDASALADGLSELLYTPRLAEAVGAAGREKIMREFTWRGLARKAVEIASGLMDERRAASATRIPSAR